MRNTEIIRKLRRLHTLLVLSRRSNVLALALRRALDFIATWRDEADVMLAKTPTRTLFAGYGPKFIKIFDELVSTGNIALIDKLQPEFDPFFCYLCEIPSIGETMARRMFFERSIRTMDDLRIAYSNNILQKIPAFGESRLKVIEEILWQTQGQAGFEPMPSFTFQYTEPSKTNLSDTPSKQLSLALDHTAELVEDAGDDENLSNEISSFFGKKPSESRLNPPSAEAESPIYRQVKTPSGSTRKHPSGSQPSELPGFEQDRHTPGMLDFGRKPKIVKAKSEPSLFSAKSDSKPSVRTTDSQNLQTASNPSQPPNTKDIAEIVNAVMERISYQQTSSECKADIRWLVSRCIANQPATPDLSAPSCFGQLKSMLPASQILFSDDTARFGAPVIVLNDRYRGCGLVLAAGTPAHDLLRKFDNQSLDPSDMSPQILDDLSLVLSDTAIQLHHNIDREQLIKLLRLMGLNEIFYCGIACLGKYCCVFSD